MIPEFKCHKCGDLDFVLIDGYPVGANLLEGVMFEVRATDSGFHVQVSIGDADFFNQLNTDLWLNLLLDYVKQTDFVTCPKCGADVEMPTTLGR